MLDPLAPQYLLEENGELDIGLHVYDDDCAWATVLTICHGGLRTGLLITVDQLGRPQVGLVGSASRREFDERCTRYLASALPRRVIPQLRCLSLDLNSAC